MGRAIPRAINHRRDPWTVLNRIPFSWDAHLIHFRAMAMAHTRFYAASSHTTGSNAIVNVYLQQLTGHARDDAHVERLIPSANSMRERYARPNSHPGSRGVSHGITQTR